MTETLKTKTTKLSLKELEGKSQEELLQIAQHVMDLKKSRQVKKLDDYLKTAHASQIEFHKLNKRIVFVWAGNRCLRGDTKIWTRYGLKRIDSIKEPTDYLSLNHETGELQFSPGSRPFQKGKENLYRVVHEHGEFYASGLHKILFSDGKYHFVQDISQSLSSSKEHELLICDLGQSQKVVNLKDYCSKYIRQHGGQLLEGVGISQDFALQYNDVLISKNKNLSSFCKDVLYRFLLKHSRLGEFSCQSSTCDASSQIFDQRHSQTFFLEDSSFLKIFLQKLNLRLQQCQQSALSFLSHLQVKLFDQLFQKIFSFPSKTNLHTCKIISIEKQLNEEVYWDIQVADTNNYFDESGICHHNSGKTTAGVVELIWRCMGTHPFKKNKVPLKTAVVGSDFSNWAQQIFEPKIKEWAPSNSIRKIDRHQGGAIKRIYWTSGSTTDLYSWDQDSIVFEGSDYDFVYFDEPPPHWIWKAMWRSTVDRGGSMVNTGTPLMSPWLYEMYQEMKDHDDPLRDYVKFPRNANAINIGQGNEALGLKRLEEFASEFTEEEKAARLDGDFVQVSGLIFKNWDRKKHVIAPFQIPVQWPIYESIDPHPQKDWAVSWIAHAPNGAKILLKSIYANGVLDEIANQIIYARGELPIQDNLRLKISRTFIDNASSVPLWQKSNTDPTARRISVREELENMIGPRGAGGPRVEVCPKNVAQKIDILKQWLHIKERNNIKRPDFFVFDNSNEDFIHEIENWAWDRHKSRGGGDLKDKPVKKNDDLLDSVMQVALVLGSKSNDTNAEIVSLIDGLGTYGGSNFGTRRNLEKRQDTINWQN